MEPAHKYTLEHFHSQLKITNDLSSIIDSFRTCLRVTAQSFKSKSDKIVSAQKLVGIDKHNFKNKAKSMIMPIDTLSRNVESNYATNVKDLRKQFDNFIQKLEKLCQGQAEYTEDELLNDLHKIKAKVFKQTIFSAHIKNLLSSNNSRYIGTLIVINKYLDEHEVDTLVALLQLAQETNIDWPLKLYNEKRTKLFSEQKHQIVLNNRVFLLRDLWDYINLQARQKELINIKVDHLVFSKELKFNVGLKIDLIQADTFKFSKPTKDLVHLNLSYINLAELEPNAFDGLNKLEKLNLSCNNLTKLNKFPKLAKLVELNLEKNQIKSMEKNVFERLRKLTNLNLSHNKIRLIEANLFQGLTNLLKLNLANNPIANVKPNAFEKLTSLELLDISNTRIKTLNEFMFIKLKQLRVLDCSGNRLFKLANHAFKGLVNLLELDLSGNTIELIEPEAFDGLDNLEILSLSDNKIDRIPSLSSENLKALYLDNNKIRSFDKSKFACLKRLESLGLSFNEMSLENNDTRTLATFDANSFIYMLQSLRIGSFALLGRSLLCSLIELDLSHCKINNIDQVTFKGLKCLKKLILNNNEIAFIGSGCFKELPLKTLDLRHNRFKLSKNLSLSGLNHSMVVHLSKDEFSIECQKSLMAKSKIYHIQIVLHAERISDNDDEQINYT